MSQEAYDIARSKAREARTCPLKHYCYRQAFVMNNLYHGTEKKYEVHVDHTNDELWDDPSDVMERVFESDFKNEAEAYISQHCPHGKIVENGQCRVCDLYDKRQGALKNGCVLPFYLVVEGTSRHYGGPEEGGWWYDWHTVLEVRQAFTLGGALRQARLLREKYPQPRYNRYSCANRGEEDTRIVLCYGEDDPRWPNETKQRPRYE
jgi:hypothetical protein